MNYLKETENMHRKNFTKYGMNINVGAVVTAVVTIFLFVLLVIFNYNTIYSKITQLRDAMLLVFEQPMLIAMFLCLIAVIGISFSPLGKIRIGGTEASPDFKRFSWYAMLFGAGMGIGFMFWGVAEPLFHNDFTPLFASDSNVHSALATTFFHWGLFPWALYALVSLALAFYAFNMHLPLAPRSMFYPLLKDRIYGLTGDIIDGLAVVITLFSLASSLGFGALQVNAGFNYLFGTAISSNVQIVIIIVVTCFATISVVTGVDKGVRILSEMNIILAALLGSLFFIIGNSFSIISNGVSALGLYLTNLLSVNFNLVSGASAVNASLGYDWGATWTLFYWAWWIGWAIFVGMFIAKISRGRTVRDFLLSVTVIPTIIAFLWFSIFGVVAIDVNSVVNNELFQIVSSDESLSLYALISALDIGTVFKIILDVISITLIVSFFVTSSDSGSLVVDGLTSGGVAHTPTKQKIFWTAMQAVLAVGLIIVGGESALDIIQMVLIITASPFSIVIILIIILLIIQLTKYYRYHGIQGNVETN